MRLLVPLVACLALEVLACSSEKPVPGAPPGSAGSSGSGGTTASGAGGQSDSGSGGVPGGSGGSAGSSGSGGNPLACEGVAPGIAPLRLLTRLQYDNTVADLLGDTSRPARNFPAENEVLGYSNNVTANQANPRLVEAFQTAAEALSARAVAERLTTLAPCETGADPTACGRAFVRSFGAKAFRRPLSDAEAELFDRLFDAYVSQGYEKGIELVLRAFLQSPQFVYRVDEAPAPTVEMGAVALGPYQLASRLSYFLTNTAPDDTLLSAAAANSLSSDAELETQARRLLESPRAREMAQDFFAQWIGVARLDGAAREAPDVDAAPTALVPDWQRSFSAFVEDAVFDQGTVEALFSSPKFFVTPALAPLYGVAAPAEGLAAVEAPGQRAGLLTQPSVMALLAHSDQSAPVLRGAFVRERVMCVYVEPPPPEVNVIPPEVDPSATTRERFAQHTRDPSCSGCHTLIDGVGFAFERYDQMGRYRELENGLPVDESGEVLETGEATLDGPLSGAAELAQRVARSPRVRDCVATQWYRYAMGRVEDERDQCSLTDIKARFAASSGQFRELLVGITLSEAFRYRPALATMPPGDAP